MSFENAVIAKPSRLFDETIFINRNVLLILPLFSLPFPAHPFLEANQFFLLDIRLSKIALFFLVGRDNKMNGRRRGVIFIKFSSINTPLDCRGCDFTTRVLCGIFLYVELCMKTI